MDNSFDSSSSVAVSSKNYGKHIVDPNEPAPHEWGALLSPFWREYMVIIHTTKTLTPIVHACVCPKLLYFYIEVLILNMR